jgi:hypothetical protein
MGATEIRRSLILLVFSAEMPCCIGLFSQVVSAGFVGIVVGFTTWRCARSVPKILGTAPCTAGNEDYTHLRPEGAPELPPAPDADGTARLDLSENAIGSEPDADVVNLSPRTRPRGLRAK